MPYAITRNMLHPFQRHLVGTWSNAGVPEDKYGLPFSYNVMPLPQRESTGDEATFDGFILKNFRYTEEITFHSEDRAAYRSAPGAAVTTAVPAGAPNRAEDNRQVVTALFYDQVVRFAQGPARNPRDPAQFAIVHVENGAWLQRQLGKEGQPKEERLGPYPDQPHPQNPPDSRDFAKQISVPHGNSILALGTYHQPINGAPDFGIELPQPPSGVDTGRYDITLDDPDDYENPSVDYAKDLYKPLRDAYEAIIKPVAEGGCYRGQGEAQVWHQYVHVKNRDDNDNRIQITNIPFEKKSADAHDYEAYYWLFSLDDGKNYDFLAYTQNITLKLELPSSKTLMFPHVTTNVIRRQPV